MSISKSGISAIISGCCNAFIEYIDGNCICTNCGRNIESISKENNEELTISIVYNVVDSKAKNTSTGSSSSLNMSTDLLIERLNKFKRNAKDITCALTTIKCPKCDSLCRMSRNQALQKIFVCTKCRHTFVY